MFRKRPPAPAADDGDQPSAHRARLGKKVGAKLSRNPMVSRIDNDKVELYIRDGFASPQECAVLRGMIDAGARPSALFSGAQGADYRTSHSCHMDPDDPLVRTISERIVAMMGIEGSHGETIQGQRYQLGQEYKLHCDYFPVNDTYWPHMRQQGGQRCWTAMIYLNAVEVGGETWFPHAGFMVPPTEGRLIVWNNLGADGSPNLDTLHAARPVEAGTKYVLTKWFRERSWLATED